jgi:hypothetical protein
MNCALPSKRVELPMTSVIVPAGAAPGYRRQRGLPALDVLAQDLRYAARGVRRNPGKRAGAAGRN